MHHKPLILSSVTLMLAIITACAKADDRADYMNGKSFGNYLTQQLDATSRSEFLKGFLEGFKDSALSEQDLDELEKLKNSWFKNKTLSPSTKVSYQMGFLSMKNEASRDVDMFAYLQGLVDTSHLPNPSYLKVDEAKTSINAFHKRQIKNLKKAVYKTYQENKMKSKAFLDHYAKSKEVVTSKSGLLYKIIKKGVGKKPFPKDTVKLNVLGKKVSGDVFYNSKTKGSPVEVSIIDTIPGWQEAIPQMTVGSVWELVVPEKLAYGIVGLKNQIEPGETVIYQIELLEVIE